MCERFRLWQSALAVGIDAEILEVAAIVKDQEIFLVLTVAEHVGAKASAASYHLIELDFGVNLLKENEIEHFGHINAGVEHIDANSDLRHLCCLAEAVN